MLVVNLKAGRGKAARYIDNVKKIFNENKKPCVLEYTQYPGHATIIARNYAEQGERMIYSFGGDGTLNEVANGLINSDTAVAGIPTGSGNDFIKSITKIRKPFEVFTKSSVAGIREIDTMKVNGRFCVNIASAGIDASVGFNAALFKKLPMMPGSLAYFASIFYTLINFKPYDLKITIDGNTIHKKVLLVAVANGKYYGGGMMAAPLAEIDDGLLDVCMVDSMNRTKIISLLNKYRHGKHLGLKEVLYLKGKKVLIESNEKFKINIDGEIFEDKMIDVEIYPHSLKIAAI